MKKNNSGLVNITNKRSNLEVISKLQAKGWQVFHDTKHDLWVLRGNCLTVDGTSVVEVEVVAVSPTDAYVQQIGSDNYLLN